MKILLSTHPDNEHGFNDDCDYAFIDLTPELAAVIASRRKLYRETTTKDEALSSIHFDDESVTFYRYLEDAYPDKLDIIEEHYRQGNDMTTVPAEIDLSPLEEKDEDDDYVHITGHSTVMVVRHNSFYWIRYSEGCVIETPILSYDLLSQVI